MRTRWRRRIWFVGEMRRTLGGVSVGIHLGGRHGGREWKVLMYLELGRGIAVVFGAFFTGW